MRLFEPDSGVTHLPPFTQVQAHSRHTIITPPRHTPQESASQVWLARRDMYPQGRVHCSCGCLESVRGAGRCRMTCPPRESSVVPVRVATHQTHSGSTRFSLRLASPQSLAPPGFLPALLSYVAFMLQTPLLSKWAMLGSNQRPPPCKLGWGFLLRSLLLGNPSY
jgi:hypothetical protein